MAKKVSKQKFWILGGSVNNKLHQTKSGFTLIELSIVLVIIGLIIGGLLVGRDLIASAESRSQISQIKQYNTSVHLFRLKYHYLPGDMPNPDAAAFGMYQYARTYSGGTYNSDGNGLIGAGSSDGGAFTREHANFWYDLATAKLINFQPSGDGVCMGAGSNPSREIDTLLPLAAIGNLNSIYVWNGGFRGPTSNWSTLGTNGKNYFTIGVFPNSIIGNCVNASVSTGLKVFQAYYMDVKLDDGLPQSGKVVAFYTSQRGGNTGRVIYSAGPNQVEGVPDTTAALPSATSCY